MTEVYASTAAVREPRNLWEILDAYRAQGLGTVELGFSELPPEDAGDLVVRLRSRGLDYLVHNYFPPLADDLVLNIASSDPEIAAESFRFLAATLELCNELGVSSYSVHAGFITDPVSFDGTSYILPAPPSPAAASETGARFVEGIDRLLVRAEQLGVRLLVENSVCTEALAGKLLLMTPDEVVAFFAGFSGRPLGLLLDTGHLNVTATTVGFDRDAFVEALAPYVEAFHLHENDGIVDEHLPAEEGSWALDVVRRAEFRDLPVVVEAKFDDAAALASYVASLEAALREASPAL